MCSIFVVSEAIWCFLWGTGWKFWSQITAWTLTKTMDNKASHFWVFYWPYENIWIGLDHTFYLRVKLVCIDDSWTLYHHSAKKQSEYFNWLPGKYYRAFYWNIKKILFRVSPFLIRCVYVNEWWGVMLSTNDTKTTINIPAILIVFISGVPRVITIRMCCSFVFLS